jgi:formylglycine-generating enzyme required for sulfatase activity/serine/threonine protein kinase
LSASEREAALQVLQATGEADSQVLSLVAVHFALPPDPVRSYTGERLGNFTLEEPLGAGGMGVVYRAQQHIGPARRPVAVKLIQPALLLTAEEESVDRFLTELHTLVTLHHENIAQIYDGGIYEDPHTHERIPYMAMELVRGGQALTAYARSHALSVPERLELFLRVCRAVQYAHEHRVVHRDLKPTNLLVDNDGRPFVIDFGLAQICDAMLPGAHLAASGTPAYMSPEQLSDRFGPISEKSDTYALGLVLYELLTEQLPYRVTPEMSFEELHQVITEAMPAPLHQFGAEYGGELATIVDLALAKSSATRISVVVLRSRLERYLEQQLAKPAHAHSRSVSVLHAEPERWDGQKGPPLSYQSVSALDMRPPSMTPAAGLRLLRQGVARYWRPLLSWLAGTFVVLNGLRALPFAHVSVPGITGSAWQTGLGLLLFMLARFPRLARRATRIILGPPQPPPTLPTLFRGPRPYGREDVLPGRQREVDDCWWRLRDVPFFILEGESGCGKSSLLNAALLPRAQQEFRVVTCRIADDPFGKLRAAFLQEPYHPSPTPQPPAALVEAMAHATQVQDRPAHLPLPKPLFLCIDQCEELFVTVREEVRQQCLTVLKEAMQSGQLRVLITIRSDFRDLLDRLCRLIDPQQEILNLGHYYTLQTFHAEQATAVLDDILQPAQGHDLLLRQQLDDFARLLVDELLRPPRDPRLCQADEKTVLPVELQTVGMMLESVGIHSFSVTGLRRRGGKAGLMRAYIEDTKTYVWHKTGVPGDQALLILRQLISPAQTKWAQTAHAIEQTMGMPAVQVAQVLDAFAEKYLVNRLPAAAAGHDGAGLASAPRYELMHEYLVQLLAEAPDPVLQKAQEAEERLRFWLHRTQAVLASQPGRRRLTQVRTLFAKPLPLLESLRLWRFARQGAERRMLVQNLRGFGLRLLLVGLLLSPGAWYLYQEARLRVFNMGTLLVHNHLEARPTLTQIRLYGNEATSLPERRLVQGPSVHLQGPADYVLTIQSGTARQLQYPVYIHGYGHQLTVTAEPPPATVPDNMGYIPGGAFRMGDKDLAGKTDERPAHDVEVNGFFMDQYEVTNARYRQCVAAGKCTSPHYEDGSCITLTPKGWEPAPVERAFQEDATPVVCVDWHQASAYCAYAGKRLPTEAEWEKAAVGPEGYRWSFGNTFERTKANYCDKHCDLPWKDHYGDDGYTLTAPVGTYPPNSYGLYDMSGNVWEWVADWYGEQFYGKPEAGQKNPLNHDKTSGLRVVRGGVWHRDADSLRVAARFKFEPVFRKSNIGIRCAGNMPAVVSRE